MTSTERNRRRIELFKVDVRVATIIVEAMEKLKETLTKEGDSRNAARLQRILDKHRGRIN